MSYKAGSVTAEIILDTKQFNEALEELKKSIATLKQDFNNVSLQSVAKDVDKLKKQMKGLTGEQDKLSKNSKNVVKSFQQENEAIQTVDRSIKNHSQSVKDDIKETERATKSVEKYNAGLEKSIKLNKDGTITQRVPRGGFASNKELTYDKTVEKASVALEKLNKSVKDNEQVVGRGTYLWDEFASRAVKAIEEVTFSYNDYLQYGNQIEKENQELVNSFHGVEKSIKLIKQTGKTLFSSGILTEAEYAWTKAFEPAIKGAEQYRQRIAKIVEETKARFHELTAELGKANAAQYKYWQYARGSVSGFGEPLAIKGYNDYLKVIKKATEATKQFEATHKKTEINLNTYKANLSSVSREMDKMAQSAKRVKNAQLQLQYFQRTDYLNQYKMNMQEINRALEKQTTNVRKAGRGLTSFNNGIVQTAHSGRILSNTLYQIRGALLSLKMIFTAMGGMALSGFASDIAEGVKETVTAKNEMEAQLKQSFTDKNGNTDWSSIQYFRKEVDKLPKTFKKVNKYSVGETVSSIGLEFDMSAKQMADALPIVTMIQSEYVRAGRKEAEAALAVKDILQGEFQRLSRETGVGKEELVAYGWDEDKTNVDGLLKALEKAAYDRHWDVFAKKATSLNDVLIITKSRFSELGADVVDSFTPLIVGAFNTVIDSIDNLSKAFNSLGTFGKNLAVIGGGSGLIALVGTVLPMVTKGMGLAEIATIGWSKSLLTATFNLNKAEVAQYGFRKALAAVITGTKASELATVRSSKAIMGRILGLKQVTLAEHGYLSALVESKALLKGETQVAASAAAGFGNLRQKLIYLAKGEVIVNEASATWGKTIKSLITSTKLWGLALKGIVAIGIVSWLASVATWTDAVKKRVEKFNDILAEGKEKIEDAKDTLADYEKKLAGMSTSDTGYNLTKKNKETAKHNVQDLELALKLAKEIKKTDEETSKQHDLQIGGGLEDAYTAAGLKNVEKYGKNYQEIKKVKYDMAKAEAERYKFEYQSLQHINEHVELMKQAGINEEKRIQYITEYNMKAEEAANHLKQFNQGDLMAGLYYVLDRISLLWIDLWNDKDFIAFWDSVQKTFHDLMPTLNQVKNIILDIGRNLLKFFTTKQGQIVGGIAIAGAAFGIIAWKLKGVADKVKDAYDGLKTLGGKLKDIKDKWKKVGDEAEEASEKMGGSTSTGGITTETEVPTKTKIPLREQLAEDAKKYARAAVAIAAAMVLVTEAIVLLNAPMLALAATGWVFKQVEPQVKKGIEGLQVIAPTVTAIMIPVVALMYVFDKFKIDNGRITSAFKTTAIGIALAITLVSEAILLLNAPLLTLGVLGAVYNGIEDEVDKGIAAIKATNDALRALVPWIPVFIAGIALAAVAFGSGGIGGIAIVAAAAGIAVGVGLVTEAMLTLMAPLGALKTIGGTYPDLDGVKRGAKAIKITSEALGYVEDAMLSLTEVHFEIIGDAIAQIIGQDFHIDINNLTGEGGVIDQLNQFAEDFKDVEIVPVDTDKAQALADNATGLKSVKDALVTIKDALKDLPNFDEDNRSLNEKYQDNVSGSKSVEGITNLFEQLKTPITQLNDFVTQFNGLEIESIQEDKVTAIQQSSSVIGTIKSAIDTVNQAVGASVDAQWANNVGHSGILGAGLQYVFGNGNIAQAGSSNIKGALDEIYNSVADIMDFNTRINGLTSEGSGDTSGITNASNMVSALQTQLTSLSDTLTTNVPIIKTSASGVGKGIVDGVKSGMSTLSTDVSGIMSSFASTLKSDGESAASGFSKGFDDKLDIKTVMSNEVDATLRTLDGKADEFYDKGKELGDAFQRGYKDGGGIHSPGYAAMAMKSEIDYMTQFVQDGINSLPQQAYTLAQNVASQFGGSLNLGNLSLPNLDQFQQGLASIPTMVANAKTQVSTEFTNIQTNIGNSFMNIASRTRSSMANMQSTTTKHIGSIKTSWKGMQDALIASAEHIRSQTTSKIDKLKHNMGDFWNKIKHPDQLIGSAGGHMGTRPVRYGSSGSKVKGLFAGGTKSNAPTPNISKDMEEYIACMAMTGGNCFAGGWNFNWTKSIQKKFTGWHTHFGKYKIDDHVNVGKFNNNKFPVKGIAEVAKAYIFDTIRATSYSKYFNSKFGDDPVAALRAGAFNCWDGTNIVLALASAFGFTGGGMGHGTWNGIGHVWAEIPGLGIIDPTAIQNRGSFTSGAVKGYHAGGTTTRNSSSKGDIPMGNTYGDIHITINNNGADMTVNEKKVDKRTSKKIYDILSPSLSTGL